MNIPVKNQDLKADQSPYDRLSDLYGDPDNLVTNSAWYLDDILRKYDDEKWDVSTLNSQDRDALGLQILRGETPENIRSAAIEAQARCIESSSEVGAEKKADQLRKMGASAEAVAFGYLQTIQTHGFSAQRDRMIVEATRIALTAKPGVDRDANLSLTPPFQWESKAKSTYPRMMAAEEFYYTLPDEKLTESVRASQQAICDQVKSEDVSARVSAAAIRKAVTNADAKGLLETQKKVWSLAGWNGEAKMRISTDHPLSIISEASGLALQEREASRARSKVDARDTDQR